MMTIKQLQRLTEADNNLLKLAEESLYQLNISKDFSDSLNAFINSYQELRKELLEEDN